MQHRSHPNKSTGQVECITVLVMAAAAAAACSFTTLGGCGDVTPADADADADLHNDDADVTPADADLHADAEVASTDGSDSDTSTPDTIQTGVTQTYYMSIDGAGNGKSKNTPFSAEYFNDSSNWSSTDNEDKLDPGDIVQVIGTETWTTNLTIYQGITLDFYDGDYDPMTMDHSLGPLFHATIVIKANGAVIREGRFDYASTAIKAAVVNHDWTPDRAKYENLTVTKNYFRNQRLETNMDMPSIWWGFVVDSEISHNYFQGGPHSECCFGLDCSHAAIGRFLGIMAGARNTIHHNRIYGGAVGMYLPSISNYNGNIDDYPDYPTETSEYTFDPDISMIGWQIAYNHLEHRCQEGISWDMPGLGNQASLFESDTVQSVDGTTVTLNHSGWLDLDENDDRYSGLYMVSMAQRQNAFGQYALITDHSIDTFILQEPLENLADGDRVIIGTIVARNWVHHNTFGEGGFGNSTILLEGVMLENLVEYNTTSTKDWVEGYGAKISALDGYFINAYITQTLMHEPAAYNIMRRNTMEVLIDQIYKHPQHPDSENWHGWNNAIYENTILDQYLASHGNRHVSVFNTSCYVSGNVNSSGGEAIVRIASDTGNYGEVLTSDPTIHVSDYFSTVTPIGEDD